MKPKNGKPYSPDITKRFLLIIDEVIRDRLTENRTTFAKKVGEHQQNLPAMKKGMRYPGQVATACKVYKYNPTWLILGTGDKKLSVNQETTLEE